MKLDADTHKVLAKLDDIGGAVDLNELVFHLGADAPMTAFEAAEQGLVKTRTIYELTNEGRAALADRTTA